MPAVRVSRRRRSSLAMSFQPAKAGIYGAARPVTFAPNVTPVSYVEPESGSSSSTPEPGSPTSAIFPPSQTPAPPPTRRRVPPGKRRSLGYIPRPPNAFMLFRADFVRQKHVPGSIETNHGSLSKIIGNCWRSLPLDEKKVWEVKAKHAKAEHKARYPDYRFKPIHGKHKDKKKEKQVTTVEDERRCEEVAQLLLEGKKGDELAAAVRHLDLQRTESPAAMPMPMYMHRRSSSVPLPNDYYGYSHANNIMIPTVSFFSSSRPSTPISSLARQQRAMLGHRRASSARPAGITRSWTMPTPSSLTRDDSPLPDVNTSLFEPSFLDATTTNFTFPVHAPHNFDDFSTMLPPHQQEVRHALGPLDSISPHDVLHQNMYPGSLTSSASGSSQSLPELDPLSWMGLDPASMSAPSHPSTAYSGSPAPSDGGATLPVLHAPQPQSASAGTFPAIWKEFTGASFSAPQPYGPMDTGLGLEFHGDLDMGCGQGYETLFQPQGFGPQFGQEYDDHGHGMAVMHE